MDRSLAGCSPWDHKESETTERLTHTRFPLLSRALVNASRPALGKNTPILYNPRSNSASLNHLCRFLWDRTFATLLPMSI